MQEPLELPEGSEAASYHWIMRPPAQHTTSWVQFCWDWPPGKAERSPELLKPQCDLECLGRLIFTCQAQQAVSFHAALGQK